MQKAVAVSSEVVQGHDLPPAQLPELPFCPRAAPRGSSCHPLPGSKGSAAVESLPNSWRGGKVPDGVLSRLSGALPSPSSCLRGWLGSSCKICCSLGSLSRGPNASTGVGGHECHQLSPCGGQAAQGSLPVSALERNRAHTPLQNISLPSVSSQPQGRAVAAGRARSREVTPGGGSLARPVCGTGDWGRGERGGGVGGKRILCVFVILCSGTNLTSVAGKQHRSDWKKQGSGGFF